MIVTKTPLRMSFVGGGSDLPVFYRRFGGAVVSTAIDKYVYLTVNRKFDHKIRLCYSRVEEPASVDKIKHPLVREALRAVGIEGGIEIMSNADIPAKGTGLGSSSSYTVGLLHALHTYKGQYASAEQLGRQACEIEISRCGEPIGKQDQYAAAYGGFNYIQFHPDDSVSVDPIICKRETLRRLQEGTLVFYTGMTRSASGILKHQSEALAKERKTQRTLQRMVRLAQEMRTELQRNNVGAFGEMLHTNWMLKRSLTAHVSTSRIDDWYRRARRAGAMGGKLLGAGSGGFLMFFAAPERHDEIARELGTLRRVDFRFEPQGSKIIFVHD
jgi:D-glycero-alpha-D-manno-heptose-7-phosphate kinase